jgi:hypothetical protein
MAPTAAQTSLQTQNDPNQLRVKQLAPAGTPIKDSSTIGPAPANSVLGGKASSTSHAHGIDPATGEHSMGPGQIDIGGTLSDLTKPIENYTEAGRAEHPILSRVGDVTRDAKELLFGGKAAGKPMGTTGGVADEAQLLMTAVDAAKLGASAEELVSKYGPEIAGQAMKSIRGAANSVVDAFAHPTAGPVPIEGNPEFGGLRVRTIKPATAPEPYSQMPAEQVSSQAHEAPQQEPLPKDQYVYHATDKSRADSIKATGLRPNSWYANTPEDAMRSGAVPVSGNRADLRMYAVPKSEIAPVAPDAADMGAREVEKGRFTMSSKGHQPIETDQSGRPLQPVSANSDTSESTRAATPEKKPFKGDHYSTKPVDNGVLAGDRRGEAKAGSESDRLQHDNKVAGNYFYESGSTPESQIGSRPVRSTVTGDKAIADLGGAQKEEFQQVVNSAVEKYKAAGDNDTIATQKAVNDAEAHFRDQGYDGYKAPGNKGIHFLYGDQPIDAQTPPWAATASDKLNENGGFTINPKTGDTPSAGHSVEVVPEAREAFDHPPAAEEISAFAAKNQELLDKHPELHIGGYKNNDGQSELNISALSEHPETAKSVATKLDQEATYDLESQQTNPAGGKNQTTQFPDYPVEQRLADLKTAPGETISTRYPSAVATKKFTPEDVMSHGLRVEGRLINETPGLAEKHAALVSKYPGVVVPEGSDAGQTLDTFKNHVVENLKWLYNQSTPEEQEANKGWYDGAHNFTKELANDYGIDHRRAAGVTASLSPQKDWDMNVGLAERVIDINQMHKETVTSPEMLAKGKEIVDRTGTNVKLGELMNDIAGKKYGELTDPFEKAAWIRLYDETNNPREFHKIGPDGSKGELRTNKGGGTSQISWGSLNEIAKAVNIMDDGSRENISRQLGTQHKVRSFYNNIIEPDSSRGDTTIDTHAVAAGLMRPLSGNSAEVTHNFSGPGSNKTGLSGTYALYQDAYTQAAKDLGIQHPRQLQSVVWEKIRKMFPAEFKTKENQSAISDIWSQVNDGQLTADEAREQIRQYASDRTQPNSGVDEGSQGPADDGELPERGLFGTTPGGGRGAASKSSKGNSVEFGQFTRAVEKGKAARAAAEKKALEGLGKKK